MGRRGGWLQTASGGQFWPLDPRPEEVRLEDVAHALSNLCRFGGHSRVFYSVAEHSLRVARLARDSGASRMIQACALLHDSAEAYLVDVPSPIKGSLGGYREAEARVERCVEERFGLPDGSLCSAEIKLWDRALLATEARDVVARAGRVWTDLRGIPPLPGRIEPLEPVEARARFLDLARLLGLK